MKIGDEVYVHGVVDEIRKDVVIIRNDGGYFGTVSSEIKEPAVWRPNMRFGYYPTEQPWICSKCHRQTMKKTMFCPYCEGEEEEK